MLGAGSTHSTRKTAHTDSNYELLQQSRAQGEPGYPHTEAAVQRVAYFHTIFV